MEIREIGVRRGAAQAHRIEQRLALHDDDVGLGSARHGQRRGIRQQACAQRIGIGAQKISGSGAVGMQFLALGQLPVVEDEVADHAGLLRAVDDRPRFETQAIGTVDRAHRCPALDQAGAERDRGQPGRDTGPAAHRRPRRFAAEADGHDEQAERDEDRQQARAEVVAEQRPGRAELFEEVEIARQQRHFELLELDRVGGIGRQQQQQAEPARQHDAPGQRAQGEHDQHERQDVQRHQFPGWRRRTEPRPGQGRIEPACGDGEDDHHQKQPDDRQQRPARRRGTDGCVHRTRKGA